MKVFVYDYELDARLMELSEEQRASLALFREAPGGR